MLSEGGRDGLAALSDGSDFGSDSSSVSSLSSISVAVAMLVAPQMTLTVVKDTCMDNLLVSAHRVTCLCSISVTLVICHSSLVT